MILLKHVYNMWGAWCCTTAAYDGWHDSTDWQG